MTSLTRLLMNKDASFLYEGNQTNVSKQKQTSPSFEFKEIKDESIAKKHFFPLFVAINATAIVATGTFSGALAMTLLAPNPQIQDIITGAASGTIIGITTISTLAIGYLIANIQPKNSLLKKLRNIAIITGTATALSATCTIKAIALKHTMLAGGLVTIAAMAGTALEKNLQSLS